MTTRSIVSAVVVLIVAAAILRTHIVRGGRLLSMHGQRSSMQWVLNALFLAVGIVGTVGYMRVGRSSRATSRGGLVLASASSRRS